MHTHMLTVLLLAIGFVAAALIINRRFVGRWIWQAAPPVIDEPSPSSPPRTNPTPEPGPRGGGLPQTPK